VTESQEIDLSKETPASLRARAAAMQDGREYVDNRSTTGRRDYRWAPFAKGNLLSVRHGAGSERIVSGLAEQLADWIVAEHPDLGASRYRASVAAWARAESLVALLTRRLDEIGVFDAKGEARQMLNALRTAERRASEERSKLGLSPLDHARLETQRSEAVAGAADLSALTRRGREAIEARSREEGE
jgi:hypothetical protein